MTIMNKLVTGSLAASVLFIALAYAQMEPAEGTLTCSCAPQVVFDHSLPMSHPINRCASKQSTGVSWFSWITGRSTSYQFHYLDLLELLTRVENSTQDNNKHNS